MSLPELPFNKRYLIDNYLYGIDLTDDNGVSYPSSLFENAIRAAVKWIQKEADILLDKTTITERHDYTRQSADNYLFIDVNKRPFLSCDNIKFYFGNTQALEVPQDWIVIARPEAGQIHLMPISGAVSSQTALLYRYFWGNVHSGWFNQGLPAFFSIQYQAGFEPNYAYYKNGEPFTGTPPDPLTDEYSYVNRGIDMDIIHLMGMYASMFALNPAGDLLVGAGIAMTSIGVDGLHQTINTTSSATNAGYGARIIQYWKDINLLLPKVRNYYKGINMGSA